MVTDVEWLNRGSVSLFVAEHVIDVPVVSPVIVTGLQPVEDKMPDCGSVTSQLTLTSLLYQPSTQAVTVWPFRPVKVADCKQIPDVPVIVGVTIGGSGVEVGRHGRPVDRIFRRS
jgi:hypothetical protein